MNNYQYVDNGLVDNEDADFGLAQNAVQPVPTYHPEDIEYPT